MNVPSQLGRKVRSTSGWTVCRAFAGALMLALTLLLTAGGAIHPLLHADAGDSHHDCAFVHWANGETGLAQVDVRPLPIPGESWVQVFATPVVAFCSAEVLPYHSRGPPQG
jgi:hypothetical protein